MKFYICEIEHEKGTVNIAIQKSEVMGISTKFYHGPNPEEIFGFSKYGEYLYPVVTHSRLVNPVLKYFLVLPKYAFGVTRIIEEVDTEIVPITPGVETAISSKFEAIEEYTGIIQVSNEIYYVYNIYNVEIPSSAKVVSSEHTSNKIEKAGESANFLIIGEKYAIKKEAVKTILRSDLVTPYKFHGTDGFIDYKKILPVKALDDGYFVVVLENEAYRTGKIRLTSGKILLHESTGKHLLETESGTYEFIE